MIEYTQEDIKKHVLSVFHVSEVDISRSRMRFYIDDKDLKHIKTNKKVLDILNKEV